MSIHYLFQCIQWTLETLLFTVGFDSWVVRMRDGNYMIPEGVSVDEDLRDIDALFIHSFELLRYNVLTLREFEDIFDAVDNFEGVAFQELADVTGVEPTLRVLGLLSQGRVSEIPNENRGSTQEYFPLGVWF